MRRLEEMYHEKRLQFLERLKSFSSKFSITTDIWTAPNNLSFLSVTVHYIDDNLQKHDGLMAFKYLEVEHSGEELASVLIDILEKHQVADRVLGITADNASNNTTMIEHMEKFYNRQYPEAGFSLAWNKIECLAHVLNLAAKEILEPFKGIISKNDDPDSRDTMTTAITRVSKLVRKFRGTPKITRLMKRIAKENDELFLKLILDVPTRWNSTLDMLERFLELKELIRKTIYILEDEEVTKMQLKVKHWICISELVSILSPLKKHTLTVSGSGSNYFGITRSLMCYHQCLKHLQTYSIKYDESEDISIGINCAIEKLIHYYDQISPMVGISVMLNPNMKKKHFKIVLDWKDEWIKSAEERFEDSFSFYSNKHSLQVVERPKKKQRAYKDFVESVDMILFDQYEEETVDNEIDAYFGEKSSAIPDILGYWRDNAASYPILAAMAKDYLTVQASSVLSERAFSSAGNLVTFDRARLKGDTIEMVQYLKYHILQAPTK